MIDEIIVVEGKDDITAVKAAVDCEVIATGGTHFRKGLMDLLRTADREKGIIVFTDPDYAGEKIRSIINREFPDAKNAFLPRDKALKKKDVGIENAAPEDIIEALRAARATVKTPRDEFDKSDLIAYGLTGPGSKKRRIDAGKKLGIGYGNAKRFLERLNHYGITREELEEALDD